MPKVLADAGEGFAEHTLVEDCSPVASETKEGAWFAIVGESPGQDEVKTGRPFVGRSGILLTETLAAQGVQRGQVDILNVIACRPPRDDMTGLLRYCKKHGLPSPIECCRPRLNAELRKHSRVLVLGNHAARAILKAGKGILALRGGPVELERGAMEAPGTGGGLSDVDDEENETENDGLYRRAERDPNAMPISYEATPNDLVKILPTVHPAFVTRSYRWAHVFATDIGRALRYFTGRLRWTDPKIVLRPSPGELEQWLTTATVEGGSPPFWTCDIETEWGLDVLKTPIRCIGIGLRDEAYVVPFYSIEKADFGRRFYEPSEERQIMALLRWFLTDARFTVVGHNFGYFDLQAIEATWPEIKVARCIDSLFIHRMVNNELPHGLGVVGTTYTDVTAWKTDHEGTALATGAKTNHELLTYCGTDCVVNWRMMPPMMEDAARRSNEVAFSFGQVDHPSNGRGLWNECHGLPGWNLPKVDHFIQRMCVGMHRTGMRVDQEERARLVAKYEAEATSLLREIRELAKEVGASGHFDPEGGAIDADEKPLNPSSPDHIRDLLYEVWKLSPVEWTATGLPSTSDEVLRDHLIDATLHPAQGAFLTKVRRYRRVRNKYLGTYLRPFGVQDEDGCGTRHEVVTGRTSAKGKPLKDLDRQVGAHCWPSDGRVRGVWNAHVTNVGRLSSSGPNLQNHPTLLRSIFVPAPGNVYVNADLDQAHLRIIAARWQITRLLLCFHTGDDPHLLLGLDLFGERLRRSSGWVDVKTKPKKGTAAIKIRDVSKTLRYAGAYWAQPETIWKGMLRAEDADGNLINLRGWGEGGSSPLSLREVQALYERWMRVEPDWERAWKYELGLYERWGFIADPVLGRRCDFADIAPGEFRGEDDIKRSQIVNFPILTLEASIMTLAEIEVLDEIPFGKWGPGTGIVNQCHDSITVECPADQADYVSGVLARALNRTVPGFEVPFTSEAEVQERWK